MKLYHHKTDGGAEYLTSNFIVCPNGEKEGVFKGSRYVVRIDGDITKDAELFVANDEVERNFECADCGKALTEEQLKNHICKDYKLA